MIKNVSMYICDVCGRSAMPEQVSDGRNDVFYKEPVEWRKGATDKIDICDKCAKVLNSRLVSHGRKKADNE